MADASGAQEVLTRRAAALAQPVEQESQEPVIDILVMGAAGARYAVEIRHVRRVLSTARRCRLPGGPGHLLALVATAGRTVPVADLAALLEDVPADPGRSFVVVLGPREDPVGLLADSVDTLGVRLSVELRPLPQQHSGQSDVALGLLPGGVVLLDAAALLDDDGLRLRPAPIVGPAPPLDPDTPGEP